MILLKNVDLYDFFKGVTVRSFNIDNYDKENYYSLKRCK